MEMPLAHRKELLARVQRILDELDIFDLGSAMLFLSGNAGVKAQIVRVIVNYLQSELRMKIID